ncbi:MAG: hypothetical protein PHE03_08665, partial [Bacteroidales bacterium]|nr:hypothetical protein [Bacteroidales bacterium]
MMTNFLNLIDDYINGNLSPNQQKAFEAELKVSPKLREELALNKEINSAIQEKDVDLLRKKLFQAKPQGHKKSSKYRYLFASLAGAAAIALLMVFGFLQTNKPSLPEQIFANNFEVYQPVGQTRATGDDSISDKLLTIHKHYLKDEFLESIPLLESIININSPDAQTSLMLASAYLKCKHYKKAEHLLKPLLNYSLTDQHTEMAKWYLALTLTRLENIDEAKKLYIDIAKGNGFYAGKAENILVLFN